MKSMTAHAIAQREQENKRRVAFGGVRETFVYMDACEREEKERQRLSVEYHRIQKGYYTAY
jgi:hypothetical protein